ncbi:hypothetical protein ACHQM5_029431 [Ranunculus cassubicifolius]
MDFSKNETEISTLAFYTLYHIWLKRNKLRFEGGHLNFLDVIKATLFDSQVWKDANSVVLPLDTNLQNGVMVEWIAPPPGWLKINFDASFHANRKSGIGAAIARDCEGKIQGGCAKFIHAYKVEEAEAQAVELVLLMAWQQEWRDIILEGDCQVVIEALKGKDAGHWSIRAIIDHCRKMCKYLNSVSICFYPRLGNTLAHNLAAMVWERGVYLDFNFYEQDIVNMGLIQ